MDRMDLRLRNYHDIGEELMVNDTGESLELSPDIVPSILSTAVKVLVRGGRIVFLLPVSVGDTTRVFGGIIPGDKGRRILSPASIERNVEMTELFTFSRWLVCMVRLEIASSRVNPNAVSRPEPTRPSNPAQAAGGSDTQPLVSTGRTAMSHTPNCSCRVGHSRTGTCPRRAPQCFRGETFG